jgi:hypothetical protein
MGAGTSNADAQPPWQFPLVVAAFGLLFALTAAWGTNKQAIGLFHDDGIYVVGAKAISEGSGYRVISLPSSPPQTKYPFLYSYLLSWLWSFNSEFPENIALLKALNCALLGVTFILSTLLYRRYFPAAKVAALFFASAVCMNPLVFTYTDYVVSDLLFVMLAVAALVFLSLSKDLPVSNGQISMLASLAGLACLTRLAAVPLMLAGTIWGAIQRCWRGAGHFCAICLAFIAPWLIWVSRQSAESDNPLYAYYRSYDFVGVERALSGGSFGFHWSVVTGNLRYLLDSFELLYLLPLLPSLWPFVVLLSVTGLFVSLRRDIPVLTFVGSSLALLLFWPFHPVRYVAPLVPWLIVLLFRGTHVVEGWIRSYSGERAVLRLAGKLVWVPALLILMLETVWLSGYLLVRDEQTTRGLYGSRLAFGWSGFEESFVWLRENSLPEAVLATAYDPMYFLYTGRRAIRPALHRSATYFYPYGRAEPDVGTAAEIKNALDALAVDFLIIDPLDGYAEGQTTLRLLHQVIVSYGEEARLVFTSTDGKHQIYALMRQPMGRAALHSGFAVPPVVPD